LKADSEAEDGDDQDGEDLDQPVVALIAHERAIGNAWSSDDRSRIRGGGDRRDIGARPWLERGPGAAHPDVRHDGEDDAADGDAAQ